MPPPLVTMAVPAVGAGGFQNHSFAGVNSGSSLMPGGYFGAKRWPPSRRIVPPFSMGVS